MQEAITGRDTEILQAESFLGGVYDKAGAWLTNERDAQIIKIFGPSEISEWERQTTHPPASITLGIDIQKALLVKDAVNIYGIVLGRRKQSRYDREQSPSLLFGFLPNSIRIAEDFSEEKSTEGLRLLVNKNTFHYRRAEFYFHTDLRKIDTDCWIDAYQYGGAGLNRWEGKDKVISTKGKKAIIDTIKRLVRNYDPI